MSNSFHPAHNPSRWCARRPFILGLFVVVGMLGGMGYWSYTSRIDGAVVAMAELRVETRTKPVQHPEGGLVGELLVREGDFVKAGDVLVRLDQTTEEASLSILQTQLTELLATRARLRAEQGDANRIEFPDELLDAVDRDREAAEAVAEQRKLFASRRESFEQERAQLRERIGQFEEAITGVDSRRTGFDEQRASIEGELVVQRRLLEKGLTTRRREQEFRRELARIQGELGSLDAEISRFERQIQETRIEITRLIQQRREDALGELREVEPRVTELRQRMIVAKDALTQVELRAPEDGFVQDLTVFAKGAVIQAGAPVMMIVPSSDELMLEARIPPNERDRVAPGQSVRVRFTSFAKGETPELSGSLSAISADRKTDPETGAPFFSLEISLTDEELSRLGDVRLGPGIPAEVYVNTGSRSPLSYLLKPLTDSLNRAFREN